ncbi:hypothetical protein T5B8_11666 [Salinisphaera sp. T5B8]|uniref:hypothetical protein n=1 Tax=Salinisphaera sp. T5B8 TaxID=1304154 RepID=UPI00333F3AF8
MTQTLWLLGAAYVALGVLVLALNIRSGWPLWVRIGCIVLVSALYFVTWHSLQDLRGWPARMALPGHFLLNASSIVEPDESQGAPGRIYLWVTPIIDDEPIGIPRAYALPYARELHTRLERARDAMRNGQLQIGTAMTDDSAPMTSEAGTFAPDHQRIELRDLPEPTLPEK